MDFLTDWLTNWLKELLISGIMGNLEGLFDTVNAKVGEIAVQVGTTPAAWNAGVFSLIRQLSETVILPIAGLVLTFVATYELIQMLLEKNNMHEFDVANIYKWVFKTACAILILSNTFDIVMAVFDVSQSVIADAAGLIQGSTDVTPDMLAELETTLEGMDLGPLLGLWLQSSVIGLTMQIMGIIIFVLVYGRMIEIYLMTSLAPLPVATLSNRELGGTGQNYLKSLFAVGFQGMLILVCVAIYAVLIQGIATGGDPIGAIWGTVGYPSYLLTNNNANIRRTRQRIEDLKSQSEYAGWAFPGGQAEINEGENRLQLFFEEKPSEEQRRELKSNGFKWAPSQGAWQRQLTKNAIYAAGRMEFLRSEDGQSPYQLQPFARKTEKDMAR